MMIIVLFVLIIMLITGSVIEFILERKGFNNGICPHCDKELRYFDTDSQGGRGIAVFTVTAVIVRGFRINV